jgi:hypothetical protein
MPGWLKVLLAVAIIVVLLIVGVVVGGVFWWSRNKGKLTEVMTEGRDYGRTTDNQGCVNESLSRYKKEPGLVSAISASLFTKSCLAASRPTSGFCTDVPKVTEFMKSAEWRKSQCSRVDLSSDSYCPQLFQPVQEFCERGPRKPSYGDNTNSQ